MTHSDWHLLITRLPGASGTRRMRVWRALKASGAGILRDGVYLLPAGPDTETVLRAQAREVEDAGGSAHLITFACRDEAEQRRYRRLFDRSEEYRDWAAEVTALVRGLGEAGEAECRRRATRLRGELEQIAATDYFPGPGRDRAAATLRDLETAINARFSPDEPTPGTGALPAVEQAAFQARRWATRRNLWVDRVACAWLIRRFIDRDAEFLWLARTGDCPQDAVGFDFDGATFTHVGDRVSFEVLLASFGLDGDPALARIGSLVHYLDVGGVPVAEADGFVAMLAGAKDTSVDDDALLDAAGALLDHLYAAYAREAAA